jgi:hypothetical protein
MNGGQEPDRGAEAAKLCALVFSNGRVLGRFAMPVANAMTRASLLPSQFDEVIDWAVVSGWIRRRASHIELTAAGIYVAKAQLDVPR